MFFRSPLRHRTTGAAARPQRRPRLTTPLVVEYLEEQP
jgi:hypothetical protein